MGTILLISFLSKVLFSYTLLNITHYSVSAQLPAGERQFFGDPPQVHGGPWHSVLRDPETSRGPALCEEPWFAAPTWAAAASPQSQGRRFRRLFSKYKLLLLGSHHLYHSHREFCQKYTHHITVTVLNWVLYLQKPVFVVVGVFFSALHWFWVPVWRPSSARSYSQWLYFLTAEVQAPPQLTKPWILQRQAHISRGKSMLFSHFS